MKKMKKVFALTALILISPSVAGAMSVNYMEMFRNQEINKDLKTSLIISVFCGISSLMAQKSAQDSEHVLKNGKQDEYDTLNDEAYKSNLKWSKRIRNVLGFAAVLAGGFALQTIWDK